MTILIYFKARNRVFAFSDLKLSVSEAIL